MASVPGIYTSADGLVVRDCRHCRGQGVVWPSGETCDACDGSGQEVEACGSERP